MPRPWIGLAILLGVIAGIVAMCAGALAQTPCIQDGLAGFERALRANHQEHKVAEAITGGGERILIFVSRDGTWTMIGVTVSGRACLLSAGDGFQFHRAPGEPS